MCLRSLLFTFCFSARSESSRSLAPPDAFEESRRIDRAALLEYFIQHSDDFGDHDFSEEKPEDPDSQEFIDAQIKFIQKDTTACKRVIFEYRSRLESAAGGRGGSAAAAASAGSASTSKPPSEIVFPENSWNLIVANGKHIVENAKIPRYVTNPNGKRVLNTNPKTLGMPTEREMMLVRIQWHTHVQLIIHK